MSIPFPKVNPALVTPGLVIDWNNSIANGLQYFRSFGEGFAGTPLYTYAPVTEAPIGASVIRTGVQGNCLAGTSTATSFGTTSNTSFALTTSGTVAVYVRANFSPTDAVGHIAFSISNVANTSLYVIQKDSSNNWLCGIVNASTNMRPTGAATGTFNTGDAFVIANKWLGGTTTASTWVKGIRRANIAPNTVNVIGVQAGFEIGNNQTSSFTQSWWQASAENQIYWVAIWNRALSDDEIMDISFAPMSLLKSPDYFNLLAVPGPAPPASAVNFRKTLSAIGGRVGARQLQTGIGG